MSMTFTMHEPPTATTIKAVGEPEFKLKVFDRDTVTVEQVTSALKRNGGVKVRGFLTPEEVAKAEKAVMPVLEEASYSSSADPTKRLGRLPQHAPELTEKILSDALYLGVSDALLSITHESWLGAKFFKTVERPVVMMSSIFEVGPGMLVQDLHRDDAIMYNKQQRIRPEQYEIGRDTSINFFVAGRDTRVENGATMFVPGSHLGQYNDQPDPSEAISAELDAGDCFFMLSSCYHGAGANTTKNYKRLVYALFMMQPHLRQEENFYLSLPLDLVKKYPLPVQRRLGYDVAVPNLGWVDHASPLETILGQKGADERDIPGYNPVQGTAAAR
ncbi:MAG: hypothetical protein M1834_002685 [Cirrosporium novae-zelandiae]|nr:MAG: hypothetical protein M1834_002685 [Cirrosporium novae-zelandiae]